MPLELPPYLRLCYENQEEGPCLTLASPRIDAHLDFPQGFYLQKFNDISWLRGYVSSEDWLWEEKSKVAFIEEYA
ncbi:hypothetical protein [Sinobacterium caligoides]|uniref:hypothetical protein n=1 Tax=Sinobacterium caligoides TaxID=933926 RepID=UPI0011CEA0AE|nr:hypothetical protein [Sinobacterium caligoides]